MSKSLAPPLDAKPKKISTVFTQEFEPEHGPYSVRAMTEESGCPWLSPFQLDCDRIIHAKSFRRLAHKTQVFIASAGDHYRTRLTHTLEVAQIARTLSRSLGLNSDLAEAIGLGHDLGHTPFGHAGERVLNELNPKGFHHQTQSLRVVESLARHGRGLNLTRGVLDGIGKHSKGKGPVFASGDQAPMTPEGQLVRAADIIAYLAHDLDDALEASLLTASDIPRDLTNYFGTRSSQRVRVMVKDLLDNSSGSGPNLQPAFSSAMTIAMDEFRNFLFTTVYHHPTLNRQLEFGQQIIRLIFNSLISDDRLFEVIPKDGAEDDPAQAVCDFISGMTDRYAFHYAESLSQGLNPAALNSLA
ncbi:MAG: dNTP triphosphohydrolase [Deltaproteobacteria bacterium]|nr:dNTP triphosphohydrolase [Deltaproteobacteria bacterium]